MKFEIGQQVSWVSQAGGRSREKSGKVVAIVLPNVRPHNFLFDAGNPDGRLLADTHILHPIDSSSLPRNEESYLVSVPGQTSKASPVLYWPRVSGLRQVDGSRPAPESAG